MTTAASKWQQPWKWRPYQRRKQRPHWRRKQRPLGGRDTSSGGGGKGTTMMAMTGNEDYNASRHHVVVNNGNWFNDVNHNKDGYD